MFEQFIFKFSEEEKHSFNSNNLLQLEQTEKGYNMCYSFLPMQLSLFNNGFLCWSKLQSQASID
jgi:hypothetical protein